MTLSDLVAITRALSDSHRMRAVMALQEGELCVCQLIELLGLAPSTISKHLSILRQAGIVTSRKEGKWVYYACAEANHKTGIPDFIRGISGNLNDDLTIKTDKSHLRKIKKMDLSTRCR